MKIGMEHAISALVEAMLPRFSPPDIGLHISVDGSYSYYKGDDEKSFYFSVDLIFQRPGNYTKVFWHLSDRPQFLESIPKDAWKLQADHDSCWRSDGIESPFNKLHWDMMYKFPDEERAAVSTFIRFGIGSGRYCKINLIPCSKEGNIPFTDKYLVEVLEILPRGKNPFIKE